MASYSRVLLSQATGGEGIVVSATTSVGAQDVHTTGSSSSVIDEVWIYASNEHTALVDVTLEFVANNETITTTLEPGTGLNVLVPGLPLTGNGSSGRSVKVFADTANVVTVFGYVNRIA
jgi:hypothetical protein